MLWNFTLKYFQIFCLLEFTLSKAEQPLRVMELRGKEKEKDEKHTEKLLGKNLRKVKKVLWLHIFETVIIKTRSEAESASPGKIKAERWYYEKTRVGTDNINSICMFLTL